MKRRWVSFLMAVVICLSLLPMQALADNDSVIYDCQDYETLVRALADPNAEHISIWGRWETIHNSGIYSYFAWPTEEVELVIDRASYASIYIHEDWTIPENVTVKIYDDMDSFSDTITVNGDWYVMSNRGYISEMDGANTTVVFNGDVYCNAFNGNMIYNSRNVFNGNLRINERNVSIANMVLGDGAKVTGQSFDVWSGLSCPSGSATVENEINVKYASTFPQSTETVTFSGNLNLNKVYVSTAGLTIGAGDVSVQYLSLNNNYDFTVNGHLIVGGDQYQSFGNVPVTVNAGGVISVLPSAQIGGQGSMSGEGTLRLYAEELGGDRYRGYPVLYGDSSQYEICESVTVRTIWKNWENPCTHSWKTGTVEPATCRDYARVTRICEKCGYQKVEEDVDGGYSDEHDWGWYSSGRTVGHRCNRCDRYGSATVTAANGIYTGSPVTGIASVEYTENWIGGEVTFSYENNVEPCEEKAIVYIHCNGQKAQDRFSIFEGDCAHEGGSLTCYAQAICNKCGKGYGTLKKHSFSWYEEDKLTWDGSSHTFQCGNEGCTATKQEAHMYYATEYDYMVDQELGMSDPNHQPNYNSHRCLICGYGSFVQDTVDVQEGVAKVELPQVVEGDTVAVAIYDENRKFLGIGYETAEKSGSMTVDVEYQGTADYLKVFFPGADWAVARPSSGEVGVE